MNTADGRAKRQMVPPQPSKVPPPTPQRFGEKANTSTLPEVLNVIARVAKAKIVSAQSSSLTGTGKVSSM